MLLSSLLTLSMMTPKHLGESYPASKLANSIFQIALKSLLAQSLTIKTNEVNLGVCIRARAERI